MKASRTLIPWPENAPRRASVNSFGIGGSNAHAILEQAIPQDQVHHVSSYLDVQNEFTLDDDEAPRPFNLVLSANDAVSLRANIKALCTHLINPRVKANLADLAYTLSERRTRLFHRAFITTRTTDLHEHDFVVAKKSPQAPKIGFIFTGQGAQWPQMGKDLLELFPWTRSILEELNQVLQAQPDPPKWSLVAELTESRTARHMRQPEISQPLVTALQLCILVVLESWNIKPSCVVGHSSGECAAAYVAGWVDRAGALKAAFYRGRAAMNRNAETEDDVGMLAVGLSVEAVSPFLEKHAGSASIACFNSPSSLTISGRKSALEAMAEKIKAAGHFARPLLVDMAYHSKFMSVVGEEHHKLLDTDDKFTPLDGSSGVSMFSSVTGLKKDTPADSLYWKTNMVSPVRFDDALKEMIKKDSPTFLIEIGPSGALAGPVSQVLKSLPNGGDVSYCASWARGANAGKSLFDVAGRLFVTGAPIDVAVVNEYDDKVRTIIDLPNYSWNHTVKYWHENAASKDWRFRKYVVHDLLGSKILGTPWHTPVWRNRLNVANVPWILEHKMGGDAIMPAAGFLSLALEALYQKHCALNPNDAPAAPNELCYRFRNVRFNRALVLEEGKEAQLMLTLNKVPGGKEWHEFRISTSEADVVAEHCFGLVRIQDPIDEVLEDTAPLKSPQSARLWYKVEREIGMDFGPAFQKLISIEATSGVRACRTLVSLSPPDSKWSPQSYYPIHPAALDGCFQTPIPANMAGERVNVRDAMIPAIVDDVIINKIPARLHTGLSCATSVYSGRGRLDQDKSWVANSSVYDSESGALVMRITGLNCVKFDVPPKPDPHTFDRVSWEPDIALLTQDQMMYLAPGKSSTRLNRVIDLIAHKKPALRVLEISLDEADTSCLWFEAGDLEARAAYSQYDFASTDGKTLIGIRTRYEGKDNTSFLFINPGKEALGLANEVAYDLAVIKTSKKTESDIEEVIRNLKPVLSASAFTLLVQLRDEAMTAGEQDPSEYAEGTENLDQTPPSESPRTLPGSSGSEEDGPSSSIDSATWDADAAEKFRQSGGGRGHFWQRLAKAKDSSSIIEIAADDDSSPAYLLRNTSTGEIDTDCHCRLS